jgi:hypothetical protein
MTARERQESPCTVFNGIACEGFGQPLDKDCFRSRAGSRRS